MFWLVIVCPSLYDHHYMSIIICPSSYVLYQMSFITCPLTCVLYHMTFVTLCIWHFVISLFFRRKIIVSTCQIFYWLDNNFQRCCPHSESTSSLVHNRNNFQNEANRLCPHSSAYRWIGCIFEGIIYVYVFRLTIWIIVSLLSQFYSTVSNHQWIDRLIW